VPQLLQPLRHVERRLGIVLNQKNVHAATAEKMKPLNTDIAGNPASLPKVWAYILLK
jgi:hypothetical protein